MYGMTGPELLTQLKVNDKLRNAERLYRVSAELKERNAARRALFMLNVARLWRRQAAVRPALQSPAS